MPEFSERSSPWLQVRSSSPYSARIGSRSGETSAPGQRFLTMVRSGRWENKMPDVIPFLTYENGIAALEWLAEVFGFTETARFTSSDGRLSHGEMSVGDGLIMLASPSPDYEGPKRHRDNCEIAASWSALPWIIDGVLVYVDDVDEHYARAKAAGAVILSEPEDGPPARRYRVEDLEGHRWMFMARD